MEVLSLRHFVRLLQLLFNLKPYMTENNVCNISIFHFPLYNLPPRSNICGCVILVFGLGSSPIVFQTARNSDMDGGAFCLG